MKQLFLDTNILLDFLLNRQPFVLAASSLLATLQFVYTRILVSSLSFVTAHYAVGKAVGKAAATQALAKLATQVVTVAVDTAIIEQALQAGRPDFEEAVQYFAALAAGADLLVTRDPKGFPGSRLAILDPLDALAAL